MGQQEGVERCAFDQQLTGAVYDRRRRREAARVGFAIGLAVLGVAAPEKM